MITLTGFADEISDDLEEQIRVLESEGMSYLELRSVNGKNVMTLTNEELDRIKFALTAGGIKVSSIGSPIGKYPIQEAFGPELEKAKRAIEIAKLLEAPYIRVFSYFIPDNVDYIEHRNEVLSRMKQLANLAEAGEVTLVLENESGVYGNTDVRCLEILQYCDSDRLRLAFDAGNFVMNGIPPVSKAYPTLAKYLEYVHVKDADLMKKIFVPVGHGDGEFADFVQKLKDSGFSGFLSVEPHLHSAYPNVSKAEQFRIAVRALKHLLQQVNLSWQ
jgi:sugar phosphate isomerase/epimerase